MTLAPLVRAMGRGPGRARSLDAAEAETAMAAMLDGSAAPEAVGALLMLMRYRGETADEIAGFTRALRAALPCWTGPAPAIDWPSYAAGRSRGLPWFLLSARLVAQAGLPVLLHGWNSHQSGPADVAGAVAHAGIPSAGDPDEAARLIGTQAIAYLPLDALCPDALRLLRLRDVLGLRSAINTALRMMNPAGARTSLQGVFHPPYRDLQRDASVLLNQPASLVIKGGGGECERHPAKDVQLWRQAGGHAWTDLAPPLMDDTTRLAEGSDADDPAALTALWAGDRHDPFAEAVVTGTAALALLAAGRAPDIAAADRMACALWAGRHAPAPSRDRVAARDTVTARPEITSP